MLFGIERLFGRKREKSRNLLRLFLVISVVQLSKTQEKNAEHHGKRRKVVRIGGGDKSLVHIVPQRANRNLKISYKGSRYTLNAGKSTSA